MLGDLVTRGFLRSELAERGEGRSRLDAETHPAIAGTVDASLQRALNRTFEETMEKALEAAVERTLSRAAGRP